ncbi:phage Gp37/Gp68 family protein [uncultured Zhongshania sp.]|uniref:phage Gp37/Gp68 family protein n=1 Tax=uncultured Zhongshania sp. TaxID=1642288 RepID=UPI0025EAFC1A|nr:phage Gp37/Gp68 family protein [uncultured Zhongshania sp.]
MSKIEWTEQTWNPVTGCTKVSPGCKHCYAETMARRLQAMRAVGYENGFGLSLMPERLNQPLKRKKPTTYFVNSMSDLFQEDVPYGFIDEVMDVIQQTPQHTYQILTKRSQNMRRYFEDRKVPFNAWLGVSVEDKTYGKPRIADLQAIRASTRFLSAEPLLEDLGRLNLKGIAWVIVGGESGAKARPMKESWAMNVKAQCERSGIDFFFKQWGSWGADGVRRSKQANGRALAGKTWDSIPVVNI